MQEIEEIPPEWGWPKQAFDAEELQRYVKDATKPTQREVFNLAVVESAPENRNVHLNKQFANAFLDAESGDADLPSQSIDPNTLKAGKWYSFLNAKGDCRVYVHNYTRDITFLSPINFSEQAEASTKSLAPLGTYIDSLPTKIDRVYCQQRSIPMILASQETCENLKTFFAYDGVVCDTTRLRRINSQALEECRSAIVRAMKSGRWLCIYLGDHIVDFNGKVCVSKNRSSFPAAVFRYGGVEDVSVKQQLYREDDMESRQCVVRPGFKVCVLAMYDTMSFEVSSFGREAMQQIPFLAEMEEVRTYNADDKRRILFFGSQCLETSAFWPNSPTVGFHWHNFLRSQLVVISE